MIQSRLNDYLQGLLCTLLVAFFPAAALAQTPAADTEPDVEIEEQKPSGDFWRYQELDVQQHEGMASKGLEYTLSLSHRFANWIDHFFDNDRTVGIKNETRIKLGAWGFWEQDGKYDDSDFTFNVRIKLPRAMKRAQFILSNDTDEELSTSRSGGVFPDQTQEDETFAGFRFFDLANLSKKVPGDFSTAAGVGFSSGSPTFRIEPRYIYTHDFDVWSSTFLQKIRWHSRDGWRTETRLDFDRALSEKYFFRSNNEIRWEEKQDDDEGVTFSPRLILSRRFSTKQALLYEWNNLFRSKPGFDLYSTALAVRYRRQVWRPWLFAEVAPQLTFRNQDDWEAEPGIFAKLEVLAKKTDK
jgi:hypothetical protein